MNQTPRNRDGHRIVALVPVVGLLLIAGCSSPTTPAPASGAAAAVAGAPAVSPPLTVSDLNPAMSDAQKAAALQRKNH